MKEFNDSQYKDMIKVKHQKKTNNHLSVWMYLIVALRAYLLQLSFNYANYQGVGYAYMLYPALKKIYGKGTKEFQNALIENIEFFNTNPQTVSLISSVQLKMLEGGSTHEEARTIKLSLMGPMSGIGDSLSQYGLYPLIATIAVGMAQEGDATGPILFLVSGNIVILIVKLALGYFGYKLGTDFLKGLSGKMQVVIKISTIIGIIVISALAVKFTKVKFAIESTSYVDALVDVKDKSTGEMHKVVQKVAKVVSAQKFIDNIIPYLMPALWVTFIYQMRQRFQWTAYRIILFTLVFGLVCGTFGILGV